MSFLKRIGNFAAGVVKSEGKKLARRGLSEGKRMARQGISELSSRYLGGCVGMGVRARRARLVKGSAAAKAHMARVRSKRTRAGCMRGYRKQKW